MVARRHGSAWAMLGMCTTKPHMYRDAHTLAALTIATKVSGRMPARIRKMITPPAQQPTTWGGNCGRHAMPAAANQCDF